MGVKTGVCLIEHLVNTARKKSRYRHGKGEGLECKLRACINLPMGVSPVESECLIV